MSFDDHKPARFEPASPAGAAGGPIPIEPEALPSNLHTECPECLRPILPGSSICIGCGHDLRAAATKTHAEHAEHADATADVAKPCPHCGYDLRGLRAMRCPECGKAITSASGLKRPWSRRLRDEQLARDLQRIDYLRPLIMIPAAAFVMTVGVALIEKSWEDLARLWITLIGGWIVGIVVYLAYGLIWLGFDSPWKLLVLRIGAVYFCTEALVLGQGTILFTPPVLIVSLVCYGALLWDQFDLDTHDCAILSILTLGVQTGIRLWIAAYVEQ